MAGGRWSLARVWRKVWFRRLLAAALLMAALVAFLDLYVTWSASARIVTGPAELQDRSVALVLGTNKFYDGALNPFYTHRIEAAARLYRAGKVSGLLVSGDHAPPAYSEPNLMREDLILLGVPGDRIASDLAGLRTLDSVVRAKEVFGLSRFVVVSQRFHCERAIFIARAHGIEAYGFPAAGVPFPWSWRARAREFFARLLVWADLYILDRRPRHLGPPQPLSFPDAPEPTPPLGEKASSVPEPFFRRQRRTDLETPQKVCRFLAGQG